MMEWDGELPLPRAPPNHPWMLPAKDDMAPKIARHAAALIEAGWKVLTCEEEVIVRLSNKASLSTYANELGMTSHIPEHWNDPAKVRYPCIMKAAEGEHGQNIYICNSEEEVLEHATDGFGSTWLLQELCPGRFEASVSLLVFDGQIVDSIYTEYEYDAESYVWPFKVTEVGRRLIEPTPPEHLAVMRDFLQGYTGICNFNYTVRPHGRMCIFEVNTRVGADLACDAPRARARHLFQKMDVIWEQMQQAQQ